MHSLGKKFLITGYEFSRIDRCMIRAITKLPRTKIADIKRKYLDFAKIIGKNPRRVHEFNQFCSDRVCKIGGPFEKLHLLHVYMEHVIERRKSGEANKIKLLWRALKSALRIGDENFSMKDGTYIDLSKIPARGVEGVFEKWVRENQENLAQVRLLELCDGPDAKVFFPESLARIMVGLQRLELSSNKLKEVPEALFFCTNLTSLTIKMAKIKGISDKFGEFKTLQEVTINAPYLRHLPPSLIGCKTLRNLSVTSVVLETRLTVFEHHPSMQSLTIVSKNEQVRDELEMHRMFKGLEDLSIEEEAVRSAASGGGQSPKEIISSVDFE